jgi:DNA replication and repair protein RecF
MPVLKKITVRDFRNIAFQELEFSPNVNCISGNNGEGKTNLLDAVYYLSMTKSAFGIPEKFNIRHGRDSFAIGGTYVMDTIPEARFAIEVLSSGEKKLSRDGKACKKISSHIGQLPVVMVSPSDISLVSESGEERRRFANAVLSQMDPMYLSAIQDYNRLLAHRNRLLKEEDPDDDLLSSIDAAMEPSAEKVAASRAAFAESLSPAVSSYYSMLSGGKESVLATYCPDLGGKRLTEVFAARRSRDRALGYTSAGIHRDDFSFTMDGYPIRRCGSQGQQKSFLVSLKFAQYEIMKKASGYPPMLLLDDVFDKLDLERISNLVSLVSGNDFGQIFITDTDRSRLSAIVDRLTEDRAYFETVGGEFTKTA